MLDFLAGPLLAGAKAKSDLTPGEFQVEVVENSAAKASLKGMKLVGQIYK